MKVEDFSGYQQYAYNQRGLYYTSWDIHAQSPQLPDSQFGSIPPKKEIQVNVVLQYAAMNRHLYLLFINSLIYLLLDTPQGY